MSQLKAQLEALNIDTTTLQTSLYDGPFEIYKMELPFAKRSELWMRLRSAVEQTHHWPLLVTDDTFIGLSRSKWDAVPTSVFDEHTPASTQSSTGRQKSLDAIIEGIIDEIEAQYDYLGSEYSHWYDTAITKAETILTNTQYWHTDNALTLDEQLGLAQIEASLLPSYEPAQLLLVPTTDWRRIPFILGYSPADIGLDREEQVQYFKQWLAYGVELVSLSYSSLGLRATQPPTQIEQALYLAWEHTRICPDIAQLDIIDRAIALYQGKAWTFWWD